LLRDFADKLGAKTYFDLNGVAWPGSLDKLGANLTRDMHGATKIHFNLDQFSELRFARFTEAPELVQHHVTNWELYSVLRTPSLANKTTFYGPGGSVTTPPSLY
jgi:hypothetical protein